MFRMTNGLDRRLSMNSTEQVQLDSLVYCDLSGVSNREFIQSRESAHSQKPVSCFVRGKFTKTSNNPRTIDAWFHPSRGSEEICVAENEFDSRACLFCVDEGSIVHSAKVIKPQL